MTASVDLSKIFIGYDFRDKNIYAYYKDDNGYISRFDVTTMALAACYSRPKSLQESDKTLFAPVSAANQGLG